MTNATQNPYRGPFAYKEDDEDIFFGRNKEVEELIDFIRKNQLTVLYGASGTGKTSLIHAKLLPQLKREYFHPIYIRINFANNEDPLQFIQKRIVEELKVWDNQIPEFHFEQTLIDYAAKNVIFKGLIKPVLFFDQFEELFTLGPKMDPNYIHRFMFQLSELIELRLPDDLKTLDYINNISSFKVVFSLRQDWIGFLDDFTHLIPSINEVRYRLKKFSPTQAMDAIMCPAHGNITREAAEAIIVNIGMPALWKEDALSPDLDKHLVNKEIDPFVLSLYCYQLYEKCVQRGHAQITADFVENNKDVQLIRNYYEEKIEKYKDIKLRIEEKLLNESGKRLIISFNKFTSGKKDLEELTFKAANETGIVRIIGLGNESEIEIVHDRLALRIFECKNERIAKEITEEATKKEREAERLKLSAQKAKKTTFRIGMGAAIIIILLTAFAIKIYIDFKNDHTLVGLSDQLSSEREENQKNQDSIKVLNSTIEDLNSGVSNLNSVVPGNNELGVLKALDRLTRQQKSSIDSLMLSNGDLTSLLIRKNLEIESLESRQQIADDNMKTLEARLSTQTNTPTVSVHRFEKKDFSNLQILNAVNTNGTYDFTDIKKNGFRFSFNMAPVSEDEKGKIEIKVYYKIARGKDYQMDYKFIQSMQASEPVKYVIKIPRGDLKPGEAYCEVRYFINRENNATTYLLERKDFTISRPPTTE
jgi:hypothetical protein